MNEETADQLIGRMHDALRRWTVLCEDSVVAEFFNESQLSEHRALMQESLALILPKQK